MIRPARLLVLLRADPAEHVTVDHHELARCVVCGHNRPDPCNLLAICRACADLLDQADDEWMSRHVQTRRRSA